MRWSHRLVLVMLLTGLLSSCAVIWEADIVDSPGPSPQDKALEDLSRIDYPSQRNIRWRPRFIRPHETLESLYGKDWTLVARFNRLDRRHAYPGMTIKEPERMDDIRTYTPLPADYPPARQHRRYILLDVGEQWIGAYERGKLKFSMPAATGKAGSETPLGIFRIDARHRTHTSSLYRTAGDEEQYPMDNALRFHIDKENVGYWIHARDLPGRPASHGCIGLFDEAMQKRTFGMPAGPVLLDSQKLYVWAAPDDEHGEDDGSFQELDYGPILEVRGNLPVYR
ncbi:L,D-transpeptidase [Trichlorobacter ammonificans]|nr:L,D-transpeptidase [Trichlorobacter ammonificans]